MGKQNKTIIREKNVEREINHVWESWDYHLKEKLEGADRIIRQMVKEMSYVGSNERKSIEFIRPKFLELIKEIALGETK